MKLPLRTLLSALLVSALFVPASFADEGPACIRCHGKKGKIKSVHPPVAARQCTGCHNWSSAHPQNDGAKLRGEREKLCFICHNKEAFTTKKLHKPVGEGACLACHEYHEAPATKLLKREGQALCLGCHNLALQKKVVHPPVGRGECLACHEPHQADAGKLLKKPGAELCYICHDKKTGTHTHTAVINGDCLGCHDPHASDVAGMLKEQEPAVCYRCHQNKTDKHFNHRPVERKCTDCHDPHRSPYKNQLKGQGAKLCYMCHVEIQKKVKEGLVVHGPILEDNCRGCHEPHSSEFRKILTGYLGTDFYTGYRQQNYAFCFNCHNPNLAAERLTATDTGFRNGDRNLHYLHVNKPEKGRACLACHEPHAGLQERLVREKVPGFGLWEIPMRFTRSANGGTCVVGCHKPMTYDRRAQ